MGITIEMLRQLYRVFARKSLECLRKEQGCPGATQPHRLGAARVFALGIALLSSRDQLV